MNEPTFKIKVEVDKPDYGLFVIEPLEQGYGQTVGNSLRRVLLTSLPGSAITSVKIDGVAHAFSRVPGLKEDVVELILNLKRFVSCCHPMSRFRSSFLPRDLGRSPQNNLRFPLE